MKSHGEPRRQRHAAIRHRRAPVRPTGVALGLSQTEPQPLVAAVRRLVDAMAYLGEPFSEAERAAARRRGEPGRRRSARSTEIQRILDPRCLLDVRINPESRISVERGAAPARLVEQGWRAFSSKCGTKPA